MHFFYPMLITLGVFVGTPVVTQQGLAKCFSTTHLCMHSLTLAGSNYLSQPFLLLKVTLSNCPRTRVLVGSVRVQLLAAAAFVVPVLFWWFLLVFFLCSTSCLCFPAFFVGPLITSPVSYYQSPHCSPLSPLVEMLLVSWLGHCVIVVFCLGGCHCMFSDNLCCAALHFVAVNWCSIQPRHTQCIGVALSIIHDTLEKTWKCVSASQG